MKKVINDVIEKKSIDSITDLCLLFPYVAIVFYKKLDLATFKYQKKTERLVTRLLKKNEKMKKLVSKLFKKDIERPCQTFYTLDGHAYCKTCSSFPFLTIFTKNLLQKYFCENGKPNKKELFTGGFFGTYIGCDKNIEKKT